MRSTTENPTRFVGQITLKGHLQRRKTFTGRRGRLRRGMHVDDTPRLKSTAERPRRRWRETAAEGRSTDRRCATANPVPGDFAGPLAAGSGFNTRADPDCYSTRALFRAF